MAKLKSQLERLRRPLKPLLVEVEMAIDTETYPGGSIVKTNLLEALEIVRKRERDQVWRSFRR